MKLDNTRLVEIDQLLIKLDLNQTQRTVYLTGLLLGPTTIIQLAAQANVHRLTTHQAVEQMVQMGLFLETYYGKKRLVYPHSIDGLYVLLEQKKFALQQLEQSLDATRSVFDYIKSSRDTFSNTRLYQGIEGINTTLLEMAKDKEAICIIYDANSLGNIVDQKLFHRSYEQRAKHHVKTRLILPETFRDFWNLERKEDYEVSLRVLQDNQLIHGGIEIRGKKTALHCYKEGLITTTIIENKEIANILLVMYESMRKSAKDYQEKYLIV